MVIEAHLVVLEYATLTRELLRGNWDLALGLDIPGVGSWSSGLLVSTDRHG
jgi:hypothetical protein